ncbi:PadR family transcriptional regulator [Actinocorallia sp. B10E7]|uniref:PadR family transcriptional regulator n=1 Tax=Actinocorallia sp. B10E7 TaxID=3153558 RepID=UPI00325CC8D8
MALRHAVLAALLDGEASGYELGKRFDRGVGELWNARPQQVYAELNTLERSGLIRGREVPQQGRPTKRVFVPTEAGYAELARFAADSARPAAHRDDLLVKVYAADAVDAASLIAQLRERAAQSRSRAAMLDKVLERLRDGAEETEFLGGSSRVGPYLACMRGRMFEQDTLHWCLRAIEVLEARG